MRRMASLLGGVAVAALLAAAPAFAGDKVVRVGVMGDMSGFASDVGGAGAVFAAEMAAADHGQKANGKPVEIISGDMQNKPDIGAAMARRWFETQDVGAITDLPAYSVALAVQEVGRSMGRLLLVSAGAIADLSGVACAPYSTEWADD